MSSLTFKEKIIKELEKLKVNESFDKYEIIDHPDNDRIQDPIKLFDKYISEIKKQKFPFKKFKTIKGRVTRLE